MNGFPAVLLLSCLLIRCFATITKDGDDDDDDDEDVDADYVPRGNGTDLELDRQIDAIRRWVSTHADEFDPADVANILRGPDWYVKRYIHFVGRQNMKGIIDLIGTTLKWRKESHLNSLKPEDFPCQFWLAGHQHLTWDRNGVPVVVMDSRAHAYYSGGLREAWYLFSNFQMDRIDRIMAGGRRTHWRLIYSLAGSGLTNLADVTGMVSSWGPVINHFPQLLEGLYLMDVTSLFEMAIKMIVNLGSAQTRDRVHIVKDKERFFLVKKRDMPYFAGGSRRPGKSLMVAQRDLYDSDDVLRRCIPIGQMAHRRGWSDASVKTFLDTTKYLIDFNLQSLRNASFASP